MPTSLKKGNVRGEVSEEDCEFHHQPVYDPYKISGSISFLKYWIKQYYFSKKGL